MNVYAFSARTIDGKIQSLADYRGNVLLIVNVASYCGLTPQYGDLESLYRRYRERGLVVLGFPSNQFNQEPDDEKTIKAFCIRTYAITFPLFAKIEVNGPNTHPLFAYLKAQQPGSSPDGEIKWNFTKFLVNRNGIPVRRYAPTDTIGSIERELVELL
ncbi:MAG: glutathione peroxidase [Chloroflexus sp.]|uniref:glutathione peroxidase n=1 Tax=Chloroflexus sp. TaxID=1904827 RepID=UPI0021DE6C35|nr:glutathione peroxidase [Chloroflexus sp.]GIV89179.1 MAG: glutathione peroxidase [Chloroflexus sp.]